VQFNIRNINCEPFLIILKNKTVILLSDLDRMFNPQSIAVIGASRNPKKIGYELVSNILSGGFDGRL